MKGFASGDDSATKACHVSFFVQFPVVEPTNRAAIKILDHQIIFQSDCDFLIREIHVLAVDCERAQVANSHQWLRTIRLIEIVL